MAGSRIIYCIYSFQTFSKKYVGVCGGFTCHFKVPHLRGADSRFRLKDFASGISCAAHRGLINV